MAENADALVKEKNELINKMLEMQKKFVDFEHSHGVSGKDYYAPESGSPLDGYRQEYAEMADRVVNLAHQIKGSHRD